MRGPLTQEDSEISSVNKKEAFAIVSERIEQSLKLQGLCTPEPTGPNIKKPFHRGHPVTKPRLCLGLEDYRRVGAWYQAVSCIFRATQGLGTRLDSVLRSAKGMRAGARAPYATSPIPWRRS
jgi:hypothetical protein